MRAVKDVAFEDRPVPSLRGPKDVRVHIAQTGICGSDVRCDYQQAYYDGCLLFGRFTIGRKGALVISYLKARLCWVMKARVRGETLGSIVIANI